jgi:hypothetical protein
MEINVAENPVNRSSEAIYRRLSSTAPEQAEAAEKTSREALHSIVETCLIAASRSGSAERLQR